jgi:hypothetical protein
MEVPWPGDDQRAKGKQWLRRRKTEDQGADRECSGGPQGEHAEAWPGMSDKLLRLAALAAATLS